MAVPIEGQHPTEWPLDDDGRARARQLAARLGLSQGVGALMASTEPKALGTAEEIAAEWGGALRPDDRLREVQRPWVGPGYRAVVHRYLRGDEPEGWEPAAAVAARVAAVMQEAAATTEGGPLVVVSHGLSLAVHLGDRLGADFDREGFWSSLAFPDAWVLDDQGMLQRVEHWSYP